MFIVGILVRVPFGLIAEVQPRNYLKRRLPYSLVVTHFNVAQMVERRGQSRLIARGILSLHMEPLTNLGRTRSIVTIILG